MILYLDTSSLLKCLIDEAHTADVLKWVDAADAVPVRRDDVHVFLDVADHDEVS